MIAAQDLMIGDWVYRPDCYDQVKEISNNGIIGLDSLRGRIMSRSKAKAELNMEDFKNSMKVIYTTSVNTDTIDEAPMAYKPMENIVNSISDTVDIVKQIKPLYNFKAE